MNRKGSQALFVALLLVVTGLVYLQASQFGFLSFDDTPYILDNESIRHWASLPAFFATDLWQQSSPGAIYYRPLFLSWTLLSYKLFGLHGGLWHLSSVAVYLAGVLLGWGLAKKLSGNDFVAAAAALLFALHPAHVESVSWLSAVVEPLLSVFFFAGFLAYFKWRESARREWLFACAILVTLALFTKETGAALPVLILAYEVLFPREPNEPSPRKPWVPLAVSMVAAILAYAAARAIAMPALVKAQEHRTWLDVVRMGPMLILTYLKQAVWPVHLAAWYDVRLIEKVSWSNFFLPLLAVIVLAAFTVWALFRKRTLGFFLLWWWVAIGPAIAGVLSLPEFDLAHDRYGYLASYGLCLLMASALAWIPAGSHELFGYPMPRVLALTAVTVALALLSTNQVATWKNDRVLYTHAVEVSPTALRPHALLGNEYLKHGNFTRALELYRETRDLAPGNWQANYAYAIALYKTRHLDEAAEALHRTLQLDPRANAVYPLLAEIRLSQGRADEALAILQSGLPVVANAQPLEDELARVRSFQQENQTKNQNGPETKKR